MDADKVGSGCWPRNGALLLLGFCSCRGHSPAPLVDRMQIVLAPVAGPSIRASFAGSSRVPADTPPPPAPRAAGASLLLPATGPLVEQLGYPTRTVDRLAVRRVLLARSYDALDGLLAAYADSAARDYRFEYRLFDAYGAFYVALPSLEPALTDWVQQRPGSGAALLARGHFFVASGAHARGANYARETSEQRFALMTDFYRRAVADLAAGLRLAPNCIVAYDDLMSIAAAGGNVTVSRQILSQALKVQPYSFKLRETHIFYLTPRWGGSYQAMAQFADESAPYAGRNPRIQALQGYVDWDRGRLLENVEHRAEALEAYGRAIELGDVWRFRYERGRLYARSDLYTQALQDLTAVLVQRPQYAEALYERAGVEYDLGRRAAGAARAGFFSQAFRDINLAVTLDPTDDDFLERLTFYRQHIPEFAPAPRP